MVKLEEVHLAQGLNYLTAYQIETSALNEINFNVQIGECFLECRDAELDPVFVR